MILFFNSLSATAYISIDFRENMYIGSVLHKPVAIRATEKIEKYSVACEQLPCLRAKHEKSL